MKVALITGGASGIGLALSHTYLKQGYQVIMVDKNQEALTQQDSLSKEYPNQLLTIHCDITSQEAVNTMAKQVIKTCGRIDLLINNAGIMGDLTPVWELNTDKLKQTMAVNLYGMIYLIQAFMPFLFEQNHRSHIINMASMYAFCTGTHMAAYAMSKHAVLALTESLYFDLKRLGKPIDVSVICPSFTDTGLLSKSETSNELQSSLQSLLSHSRPASDVAKHIAQEIDKKRFYILPDKEVKSYCEERSQAIVLQENPHQNNVDKLVNSLLRRESKNRA